MILLISYDLKVPGRDYSKLYDTIKAAPSWCHYLESTWFISTTETVATWADKIRGVVDENDRFIVVDITGRSRNGWLPRNAWDWLSQHNHD
jgi:hypothetical protein